MRFQISEEKSKTHQGYGAGSTGGAGGGGGGGSGDAVSTGGIIDALGVIDGGAGGENSGLAIAMKTSAGTPVGKNRNRLTIEPANPRPQALRRVAMTPAMMTKTLRSNPRIPQNATKPAMKSWTISS